MFSYQNMKLKNGNHQLAFCRQHGKKPYMVFLSGYRSDMQGSKAQALAAHAGELEHGFLLFDYHGHGQSDGNFLEGTIGGWLADTLFMLNELSENVVLVGSSMGGWLALLAALAKPQQIKGVVTIAAAPDFTHRLLPHRLTTAQKNTMMEEGVVYLPSAYDDSKMPFTRKLVEEANSHLLLDKPIPLHCPIHMLQGCRDEDVPFQHALKIMEKLPATQTRLTLIGDGDHRLSRPQDIDLLKQAVTELLYT
ncbi:MAG: alpha/beta hydrolase [Alphaproteobacteria bacterium]